MDIVFLKLLNMSIAAGWLILAVILLRLLLKKAPKAIHCSLWALVAIRLICPFSLESALSLIPSAKTVPEEILYEKEPAIESGIRAVDQVVNPVLSSSFAPADVASVNPLQIVLFLAAVLWLAGAGVLMLYAGVSYLRLRLQVKTAMKLDDKLRLCDQVQSPFILGVLFPRIYLPSNLDKQQLPFVIAHEKAHLKRHDHWWKPLGFLLLSVYWFHPLCWIAYILFCRDIELACDERVIREMGSEDKKDYAEALFSCSVPRSMAAACPLAFGEVGIKARIKAVLHYKKPSFWLVTAAVAVCIVSALCFLTNPVAKEETTIFGARYSVKKVLYDAPEYDFAYTSDTAPEYVITSDALLMERGGMGGDTWNTVNVFHETGYSREELLSFFALPDDVMADQREQLKVVEQSLDKVETVWRVDLRDETKTVWLVMQTEDNQLLLATGYDMGSRLRIRWLWEMEKQSGRYDNEYLAAQIASMSGGNVWIFAIYESDTIPQNILVGYLNDGSSNRKGFSVFQYDAKTDSYKTRGYTTFGQSGSDALVCFTIAKDDWGLDHSVTIILSNRSDLSYVTVEAKGELHRESVGKIAFPSMLVIEWSEILSEEQVAAMEVHYYNNRGQELND